MMRLVGSKLGNNTDRFTPLPNGLLGHSGTKIEVQDGIFAKI
jgi:hypothetical protein